MSTVLEQLQALNPELNIRCVCDPAFRKYGNVHKGFNVQPLIDFLKKNIEIPRSPYILIPVLKPWFAERSLSGWPAGIGR